MRSVTTPCTAPSERSRTRRRELDPGRSRAKRKTLESRNALVGILGLLHVPPELLVRHPAGLHRLEGGPEILRTQEPQVRAILHERRPDGLRLRREQAGPDETVEELGLGPAELDGERRFHSIFIANT